jgi:dienelactone hydrolase
MKRTLPQFLSLTREASALWLTGMKFLKWFALGFFAVSSLQAALVEKAVTYEQGSTTLEGFHVYDNSVAGKRPAVLVIHQWTGLTENEKRRSLMLAEMGYNVFAADIYGKGIRPQPPEAGAEAGKYKKDRALFRARLTAALDVLKSDERTEATKIAAIGYCFGGTGVLEIARAGMDVAGVVSFHGGLNAQDGMAAEAGKISTKILVLHGADDPYVSTAEVADFQKEMTAAKADWQLIHYSGAVHAFTQKEAGTDNSKGAAYNEAADRRSWAAMQTFFAELFK